MASYGSTNSQFGRGQPASTREGEFQGFIPSSQYPNEQDYLLALSAQDMENLNATSFGGYNYQQAPGQPHQGDFQQVNTTNADNLYYAQNVAVNSSPFLDQSMNTTLASTSQSINAAFSPSTIQGTLSPEPYGQNPLTPETQFEAAALERALADANINSPLAMGDVGHGAYAAHDFSSDLASASRSPILPSQIGSPYGGSGDYSLEEKRSQLSLNVPQFGNIVYQPEDSSGTVATNTSNNDYTTAPHLRSPVVRVEDWEGAPQANLVRSLSRRSHGSRRSNNLLSPYADDDLSEHNWSEQPQDITSQARNEDGSWVHRDSGAGGISPKERGGLNSIEVPTLDEQEEQRHRANKNAEVEYWITSSAAASENEDESDAPRRNRRSNRPRARSTNDIAAQQIGFGYLQVPQPGPGVVVNEASDYGEEDVDADEDNPSDVESDGGSSSPPADVNSTLAQNLDLTEISDLKRRLWTDIEPPTSKSNTDRMQPATANAAMVAFVNKAKEVDTASLAATIGTIGSRRRSISDIDSLMSHPGVSRKITGVGLQDHHKEKRGLFSNFRRTPSGSNNRKRKSNTSSTNPTPASATPEIQVPTPSMPRRMSSLIGRPKTPKLDTNVPSAGIEGRSPIMAAYAKIRNRSKSDFGRARSPGTMAIAHLWSQSGGPPVGLLGSPSHSFNQVNVAQPQAREGGEESDEDAEGEPGVSMDLSVRLDMNVIPTSDGFQRQIKSLNPHVNGKILERLIQEQNKRYKRLVDIKIEHEKLVQRGKCGAGSLCIAQGGEPKILQAKATGKGGDAAPVVFQIIPLGASLDSHELIGDNQAAQFPQGVPLPPVKSLPAKFECPYCFKVKEFKKPSDWTKHIHEDVQPFTCTFPDCSDCKSFKRKADWVRHESEKHRQLESWTCKFEECTHVCYRRDNFVQHLVREHKVPEPKIRTGRSGGARSPARTPHTPIDLGWGPIYFKTDDEVNDYVNNLVDGCRRDSTKEASGEPCRFCGNICTSFKKLTVHLAKHMEQLAMPVIPLIEQHPGAREHNRTFAAQPSQVQTANLMPPNAALSMSDQASYFFEEPSEMDALPAIAINGPPPQLTFPPVNFSSSQLLDVDPAYSTQMMGASYPPAMMPSRSRGSSFNEPFPMTRQDASYPPANMMSRGHVSQAQAPSYLGMNQQSQFGQQQDQYYTGSMHYNGQ